jgi:chromosome segregation ATPase
VSVATAAPFEGLPWLIAAFAAVGGLGGLTTLLTAPRQGRSIAVQAAEAAVRSVNEAMETLRNHLADARQELQAAKTQVESVQRQLDEERIRSETARENAAASQAVLAQRIGWLQDRIRDLERQRRRAIDRGDVAALYEGPERRNP